MQQKQIKYSYVNIFILAIAFVVITVMILFQGIAMAQDSPQTLTNQFYQWYLKTESVNQKIAEQKAVFEPELYGQLVQAWAKQPGADSEFVDFDVFSGTQTSMAKAVVRSAKQPWPNHTAEVDVDLYEGRRRNGKMVQVSDKPVTVKVLMAKSENAQPENTKPENATWRIRNLVYAQSNWENLLCILREINRSPHR